MKKKITLLIGIVLTTISWAQSPEKMSYQAVVRDADNALVTQKPVGMQISILQGSVSGTAVYTETHTPSTNVNGLVSLEIGTGATSDDFSTINWSGGPYFIKTETDPEGGTNYTITGTSQLMSVPYALHAKTAENVTGTLNETDPIFTAWDKSTGITITESQISDLSDSSTTNELNTSVALNGTNLEITDAGGTITTDLSSLTTIALERQLFKTSGTFTVPSDVTSIRVTMIGGGGSGGSRGPGGEFGAGGEAGNYVRNQIVAVTPGATLAVTVGTGGVPATCSIPWTNGCPGNPGGTSSVGTLVTATGGAGGCGSCLSGSDDKSGKIGPFGVFGSGSDGVDVFEVNSAAGNPGMVLIEYYFW